MHDWGRGGKVNLISYQVDSRILSTAENCPVCCSQATNLICINYTVVVQGGSIDKHTKINCLKHEIIGLTIATKPYSRVGIQKNRALCDNFFKLYMVLGMDMTFSKTTAHKSGETPGGRYAQNPIWPPLKTERAITLLILRAEHIVIPLF